jgi:hypothetical protein
MEKAMRTRDVLRWNFGPNGLLEISRILLGAIVLGVLDRACVRLEAWIDQ